MVVLDLLRFVLLVLPVHYGNQPGGVDCDLVVGIVQSNALDTTVDFRHALLGRRPTLFDCAANQPQVTANTLWLRVDQQCPLPG